MKLKEIIMTKKINLKLTKLSRHIWETDYDGLYIDFFRLPSDRLWRTSYFGDNRVFGSMKIAKMVVEKELQEKHEWLKAQGYL